MRVAGKGLIDRSRVLKFTFGGQSFEGFAGDTLASALLANGQRLIGRSFKYHRPRGVVTAGSEEPNALVTLERGLAREPNSRATMQPLFDGLVARPQNAWPSLKFDVLAVNDVLAPFLSAGFYYKTFKHKQCLIPVTTNFELMDVELTHMELMNGEMDDYILKQEYDKKIDELKIN